MSDPGHQRLALWIMVPVGVIMALFVVLLWTSDRDERGSSSALVGQLAPPMSGQAGDGSLFDLDDQRGRWSIVNFFATWCAPCVQEHPELVAFSRAQPDVALVSVVFDDSPEAVADFFERNGGDWPVLMDSTLAIDWAVAQVPESFVVAPNGLVAAHLTGGVTATGLAEIIADLEGSP